MTEPVYLALVFAIGAFLALAVFWSWRTRRPASPASRFRGCPRGVLLSFFVLALAGCSAVAGHSITVAYDHPEFGRVDVTYTFPEGEVAPVQSLSLPGGPSLTLAASQ